MERVTSKRQNYRLYEAGEYGNKITTWDMKEAFALPPDQKIVIRSKKVQSPFTKYGIAVKDVPEYLKECVRNGGDLWEFTFNEVCPDDHLTIQGEIMMNEHGTNLTYSMTPGLRMRDAMRDDAHHLTGVKVMMLLRAKMTPNSFDGMARRIA